MAFYRDTLIPRGNQPSDLVFLSSLIPLWNLSSAVSTVYIKKLSRSRYWFYSLAKAYMKGLLFSSVDRAFDSTEHSVMCIVSLVMECNIFKLATIQMFFISVTTTHNRHGHKSRIQASVMHNIWKAPGCGRLLQVFLGSKSCLLFSFQCTLSVL